MADLDLDGRPVPWSAARRDYEAGEMTTNEVARQYRVRLAALEQHARTNKWVRPGGALTDRRILIFKLLALLERQMDLTDMAMTSDGRRETAALVDLIRSLDKIIELEKAATPATSGRETAEMSDIRRRLEARINAITKA